MENDIAMNAIAVLKSINMKNKSVEVEKNILLKFDAGHLMAEDINILPSGEILTNDFLRELSRDNAQLLINHIFQLPSKRVDAVIKAELPKAQTLLPREHPIPKAKPPTKWETFAKLKGIKKQKRSFKVWDEQTKTWKPRHGYQRADDNTVAASWLEEISDHQNNDDHGAHQTLGKEKKIEKNNLKNSRKTTTHRQLLPPSSLKTSLPLGTPLLDQWNNRSISKNIKKEGLEKTLSINRRSTASMGQFDTPILEGESKSFLRRSSLHKKHHYDPVAVNTASEKKKSLALLERMMNESKKPPLSSH
jgi:regulator of ribosome biosynthesis